MLKKIYYKYLQSLLIFSIVVTVLYITLRYFVPDIVSHNLHFLIVIFVLVTAVTHYVVVRTDVERMEYRADPELSKEEQMKGIAAIERKFITRYMLVLVVKILSFLVFIALYAYFNKGDAMRFMLNFMVIYLLYSVFEIIYIKKPVTGKIKQNKK